MSAAPNTIAVQHYDGQAPVPAPATLIWSGTTVKVIGARIAQSYPTKSLRVSPRIGAADRFVALPDGAQLQCPDHRLLDRFPQEGRTEGFVAWLEQRWPVALAGVVVMLAGLAWGYFYGLPAAAEHLAARVPVEYEKKLGENTLAWLDENQIFLPSKLEPSRQQELAAGFTELSGDLPMAPHYRLLFRDAPGVGPNALAFPGGIVVITDQMIDLAEAVEEVFAVLAHEIGHVEGRHALRHILQDSITAAVAATLTADASSLTLAASGVPVMLVQAKYSREFEAEADEFAFDLLKRHGLSPIHFAALMERLGAEHDAQIERRTSFLSTHPVTADRIARARAAAEN